MKHWRKMFGVPIAAVVLSFSLSSFAMAQASPLQDAIDKAHSARTIDDLLKIGGDLYDRKSLDDGLYDYFDELDASPEKFEKEQADLIRLLEFRREIVGEQPSTSSAKKTVSELKKSNPLYADAGAKKGSNWIGKAFERIGNLFGDKKATKTNLSVPDASGIGVFAQILIYFFIFLLAAGLLAFLIAALRMFKWKMGLKRKAKALLEDDEPERTLDEWLQLADDLTAQAKYREAVRCLYLACLLKFDEHGVARFERGETNWEHLARIKRSSKLPSTIDFELPTRQFDGIWYGFKGEGLADVGRFRAWYQEICEKLQEVKAA